MAEMGRLLPLAFGQDADIHAMSLSRWLAGSGFHPWSAYARRLIQRPLPCAIR